MSFRILLVETDRAAATVADRVLTNAGYRAAWVDSFADAIRQTTADCPDLMITALRLGPFNGLHLVLALPRQRPRHAGDHRQRAERSHRRHQPVWRALAGQADRPGRSPEPRLGTAGGPDPARPDERAPVASQAGGAAGDGDGGFGPGRRIELRRRASRASSARRGPDGRRSRSSCPTFGVSVQAVACWSQLAEEGGSWRCGAEVAAADSDATRTWRWIVDSLN